VTEKNMNYWLDLFTGTTWKEFREAGATVSGFSAKRRSVAERVKTGDIFLCYLTGVMRWVGALEVTAWARRIVTRQLSQKHGRILQC